MKTYAAPARLFGLDTLRACAVLAVMLYHLTIFGELPERLLPVASYGWMGVDLFFVLSGFLIGQQVLKLYQRGEKLSLGEFYLRRAYRILPAYFVVLAIYFLAPVWREAPRLAPIWKFFTFTTNIYIDFSRRAFSHAWSLCVEEYFYLILPLLVMLLMRKPSPRKTVTTIAAVLLFGIGVRAYVLARYPDEVWRLIYFPTYTRLDGLTMGVSLAVVRTFRPAWWQAMLQRGHALLFAGCACVGIAAWMFQGQELGSNTIVGFPLLSLGLALVTASSVSSNGVLSRVKVPGMETIATLAFALYLTHKAVGHLMMTLFPHITEPKGPASWLLYAVACFATAWVLHVTVERPFLRLRDRFAQRKSDRALEAEMRRETAL